ncbi:MAG: M16 family metallopeptidase [Terriglobia bacterium]
MQRAMMICVLMGLSVISLQSASGPGEWQVPVSEKTLSNGLRVVVSQDNSAPTFGVCVTYGIGFRLEPRGRTGFAHLFEHMMFEGTPDAPKGVFDRVIEDGGGTNNADTRFDFTEYFETAPISALDPVLWLEADRMRGLAFSQATLENQRKVVEEEVRRNILNQPYGGFYWLDLMQRAFDKYPNSHNFYGDFHDLNAATLEDVERFFNNYYAPNNAVLTVVGDVTPERVFEKAEQYFGAIPKRELPSRPDVAESPQTAERRFRETDKLARVPALAIGYRMPPPGSSDSMAAAVTGEVLHNGQASRLYQALVKEKKVAIEVDGGANWPLGSPYAYGGPSLMTSLIFYPPGVAERQVLSAYDDVIKDLTAHGVPENELERVRAKMRSDWYSQLETPGTRASILGQLTLFNGDPQRVNQIPAEISRVTSSRIQAFARHYLAASNRTIIDRMPAPSEDKEESGR